MKLSITFLLVFLLMLQGFSQEETNHSTEEKPSHSAGRYPKNFALVFIGSTHIWPSGINMPTFGVEYGRKVFKNFGVGITVEYEAGQHIISKDEHTEETVDITRENSILLIPTIEYAFFHHFFILTVGYGVEFEKKENLALFKVGLSVNLALKNKYWYVLPSVSYDRTKRYDGLIYGFALGRAF